MHHLNKKDVKSSSYLDLHEARTLLEGGAPRLFSFSFLNLTLFTFKNVFNAERHHIPVRHNLTHILRATKVPALLKSLILHSKVRIKKPCDVLRLSLGRVLIRKSSTMYFLHSKKTLVEKPMLH